MSDFKVEPQALEHFAATSVNRQYDLHDVRTRMQNVHLPRDGFGYVPGIGNRVYAAYDEFVQGCTDSVASAAESMASIAAAVRGVVVAYTTSDDAARASQMVIDSDLGNADIRGIR
jgi:hypothetical protein